MESQIDILAALTESQRQAVTHIDGPLLIIAGPGSGKTRVITHRIAYLISQGIPPWRILAITFTNKASDEMRQRLLNMNLPRGATICTFHSLCARLLREFADRASLPPNFSIYDTSDQLSAIRLALKHCELDAKNFPPSRVLNRISSYKNDLVTPENLAEDQSDFLVRAYGLIYRAYQQQLEQNAALDFDDLLMKFALLLRDDVDLRSRLNQRYQYVLVDEYQDTNHCQYQIARGLSLNHSNLCVTGDPDQSIYGWRGADIGNILAFEDDYPDARVIRLEENFRSTPEVLHLADEVIRVNTRRKEKQLFTHNSSGPRPVLNEYADEHTEAQGMTGWIQTCRREGWEYRDIAVFYRVNSISRILEECLIREKIPYQIVRGIEFFKRREIKDMVAYLRFLVNPQDQVSLRRIINTPTRGIGNTTLQRLFAYQESHGAPIWQVLQNVSQVATMGPAPRKKVTEFVNLINKLKNQIQGSVENIMNLVFEKSNLKKSLEKSENYDAIDNIKELISSAAEYDAQTEKPALADYLQQIALISDTDSYDNQSGAVSLMTLHAAKGLEFPAVLIVAVEDGLIPHSRSIYNEDSLEEERRLLFVGITRAKQKLSLSYARNRMIQGMTHAVIRSEFLRNLSQIDYYLDESDESCLQVHTDIDDKPTGEFSDSDYTDTYHAGQCVLHPSLGMGRIQEILPDRKNSKVIIQFNSGSRKTIYLKYVKLEKVSP